MTKKRFFLWLLLIYIFMLFYSQAVFAEIFRYKHLKGEKYRLVTEVKESVYTDGVLLNNAEILNKIAVTTLDVKNNAGLLQGNFIVSEKAWGNTGIYKNEESDHTSQFWRDELGKYTIEKRYLYPIVRSIPLFPQNELKIGDCWTAEAEEVHDLSDFGITNPLHIPLKVYYEYIANKEINGVELAIFKIQYASTIDLRKNRVSGHEVLAKVKGTVEQTYYWDIKRGQTHAYEDLFDFIYIQHNGQVIEFEGISKGTFIHSQELDKEQMKNDIQKEIDEKGLDDVTVTADKEGVTITLENIQFLADSAVLLPSEKQKLDTIATILKKYQDRDLSIIGHTAFAGIEKGLQKLSEERAAAVGQYLLSKQVRQPQQLIYKGLGPNQPIADNKTEAGRRKNRRVEIKILEN